MFLFDGEETFRTIYNYKVDKAYWNISFVSIFRGLRLSDSFYELIKVFQHFTLFKVLKAFVKKYVNEVQMKVPSKTERLKTDQ